MATYDPCGPSVVALAESLIRENHYEQLGETGVTIDYLFVFATRDKNGIAKGPALKVLGTGVDSITSKTSTKQRAKGAKDASVEIDGDIYKDASSEGQVAILDLALERIEVMLDEDGGVEIDDRGRPKISIRPYDYLVMGFWSTTERNGDHASEVMNARLFCQDFQEKCGDEAGLVEADAETDQGAERRPAQDDSGSD